MPSAAADAKIPNAIPLFSCGRYFAIIACGSAYRIDAPIPCKNLDKISILRLYDKPHIKELVLNIINPRTNNSFKPILSPNLPKVSNRETTVKL